MRAAALAGAMTAGIPRPPSSMPGARFQKLSCTPSREKYRSWAARRIMPPVSSQREPSRSERRPASGAMTMIRPVIGRNVAPASTGV